MKKAKSKKRNKSTRYRARLKARIRRRKAASPHGKRVRRFS